MKMSESEKIFITGATGFVGRNIIREGIKQGYSFTCLVRNISQAETIFPHANCSFIEGDITRQETLQSAIKGNNAVINLVGIITAGKHSSFEEIHFKGAKNLIDAAKNADAEKFIQMRALGAREDGKTDYQVTKWHAEEYLRKSGLNYTIFKPSVIFGKEDKFINLFVKILKFSPIFPAIGRGTLEPVWVGDVAECFIDSLTNPKTFNQTIELGGGKVFSQKELLNLICRKLNLKRIIFPMPPILARFMAGVSELTMHSPLLTKDQLIMLDEKNQLAGERSENIFKILFKTLEEYLEEL